MADCKTDFPCGSFETLNRELGRGSNLALVKKEGGQGGEREREKKEEKRRVLHRLVA